MPKPLAGIVLGYVTTPGVDLLAIGFERGLPGPLSGLASHLADITIVDPKLKPRSGQSATRPSFGCAPTGPHICVRIRIQAKKVEPADSIRQETGCRPGSTVTYSISRDGDFRNDTYLRLDLPSLTGCRDHVDVQISHEDLWAFICGDDSAGSIASSLRRRLDASFSRTHRAVKQVRERMRAIMSATLGKK